MSDQDCCSSVLQDTRLKNNLLLNSVENWADLDWTVSRLAGLHFTQPKPHNNRGI